MPSIRLIEYKDFKHNNYGFILEQLSEVNIKDLGKWIDIWNKIGESCHKCIWVYEDSGQIIGTISLLIEQKFIHNGGKVGHIEDLVVDAQYRGKGIGQQLCEKVIKYAKQEGCYKVILNCNQSNIKFYEKIGFKQYEVEMRINL
jgi:glucosamine-phosphate N-acetyltransferase